MSHLLRRGQRVGEQGPDLRQARQRLSRASGMLAQAQYPDLWTGRGYPPMPVRAALLGEVVHRALETIVKALVAAGCESTLTAGAVQVLRELDGITAIAERALNDLLDRLDGNLRIDGDRMRRLSIELTDRLPDVRFQIQAYLSRTTLPGLSRRPLGKNVKKAPLAHCVAHRDDPSTRALIQRRN